MTRIVRPGDGPTFELGGISARTLVAGADTAGTFAIVEAPIGPKALAGPLHTHHHEDALWYVLDGEFGAQVGDQEIREGPGALIFAPRGIPHTYWNPGTAPARYLEVAWPAGLERFLEGIGRLVGDPGPDILTDVAKLSQDFGVEMHWDSIATLMESHGLSFAM
ncbi:MAG: cupin domain-containing protein [Acidimicrobiales bacterium]